MPTPHLVTSLLVSMLWLGVACAQGGWTAWSTWSECSRTCDGGASYQLRKCPGRQRCEGESIQYKTCNRVPCPQGSVDFRAQQCAAYNDVIYENRLYEWVPISEPRDPCSLRCRATSHPFSVMLAPKVLDGTRCDDSSIDICINGRCRKVGCDGLLESTITHDACGVCGGDGTSCRPRHGELFRWVETEAGPCSVSCGVGLAKISMVCKDQRNQQVVYNTYCSRITKPQPAPRECTAPACAPVWITGQWQACSVPCGGGTSRRHVYCVEELQDGSFRNTFSHLCITPRPVTERSCNDHVCPKWYAGSWSPCSVTCAKGVQHREVICRRTQHYNCRLSDRPPTRRPCDTYVTCMGQKESLRSGAERELKETNKTGEDATKDTVDINTAISEDDIFNNVPLSSKSDAEISDFLNSMLLQGNATSVISPTPSSKSQQTTTTMTTEAPPGEENITTSSVAPPSAATAAPRRQKVKILKEKPDNVASLFIPDTPTGQETYFLHAAGRKTSFLEPYQEGRMGAGGKVRGRGGVKVGDGSGERTADDQVLSPDGDQESEKNPGDAAQNALSAGVTTVPRFITSEWGVCSATCGYGIRTRLVICKVYLKFSQTVQDLPEGDCGDNKPEEVEQCFLQECEHTSDVRAGPHHSYRWRHDSYSACNVTCLGGVQIPTYKCRDLVSGREVDTDLCTGIAKPLVDKIRCNEVPCPPRWRVDQFRPCSALCGGGSRRRRAECIQELARGQENVAVLPDSDCPPPIPPRSILCNLLDCPPSWVVAGEWSQCSVTCGEGLSTRLVLCQQVVAPGRVQNVSDPSICPSSRPDTRRPCYSDTCPEQPTSAHVSIETDSTRYVMLTRARRLQLVVGGQAVLVPGVNVVVRCPARHYNRKLVYWRKNDELLPRRGRIKVSRHGALHLKRTSSKDAGVYTCVVDANSANISVSFQSAQEAERLLQERLNYLTYHYKELLSQHRVDDNRVLPLRHHLTEGTEQLGAGGIDRFQELLATLNNGGGRNVTGLPYVYVSGHWSSCSRTCGYRGVQWRNITCEQITQTYIRVVEGLQCRRQGLAEPLASQDCGMFACPHWEVGPWSRCSGKTCSRRGVGTSTRALYCVLDNGTTAAREACESTLRPESSRECRHDDCTPNWRPSGWSKCSRSCGGLGMKRRTLGCVWVNNDKPAGRHCKGLPKPPTDQACWAPNCGHVACIDKSSTCSMIPRLKLCHVWSRECCWSCQPRVG